MTRRRGRGTIDKRSGGENTLVDDVKVYLLRDESDDSSATTLQRELEARFPASLGDKPEFQVKWIEEIPAAADIGTLSLVLLITMRRSRL